jgi:hypothetical protein
MYLYHLYTFVYICIHLYTFVYPIQTIKKWCTHIMWIPLRTDRPCLYVFLEVATAEMYRRSKPVRYVWSALKLIIFDFCLISGRTGDKPRVLFPEDQKHDLGATLQARQTWERTGQIREYSYYLLVMTILESGWCGSRSTPLIHRKPLWVWRSLVSRTSADRALFHWLLNINGGTPIGCTRDDKLCGTRQKMGQYCMWLDMPVHIDMVTNL